MSAQTLTPARRLRRLGTEVLAVGAALVVFVVPFVFIVLTAFKDEFEASDLTFSLPTTWPVLDNLREVFAARDGMLLVAFKNSTILTVSSVAILVVLCSMVAFVLQRRPGRVSDVVGALILSGLIIPPAIVPTIWVLQKLHLFKTIPGLVLVEVAFSMSFTILLYRAFIAAIPRELDEAAVIDGCSSLTLFFRVIFPLLRPVTITSILTNSVFIFNDFVNPLYFTPGDENATVQLTLYNFLSQFSTQYNLLFMNILVITIPPLLVFVLFNGKIVSGMTSGAVKG
ncbi:carbohydrate ABC transporter permease [Kineosporia sp. R_H_3]|uniref:carbohydrate ABC transporter permease n=1 Tax=Kineosporia sp. R_H_3 TaxID=1961848 RepID=UPI0018E9E18D|nr:carbohydrate ABC transporter permease [Kineosporia sp. R_H_3]